MGSGGDRVPAPAAWSRSQGCAAVLCSLRASGHHPACYLSALSHPAHPVDEESLDGCQGSPAGRFTPPPLANASGTIPWGVPKALHRQGGTCTASPAPSICLQLPRDGASHHAQPLPQGKDSHTTCPTPLRVPRACSLQFPQQNVCPALSPTSPRAAARSQRAGAHQLPFD